VVFSEQPSTAMSAMGAENNRKSTDGMGQLLDEAAARAATRS
jgi:hypothetical protein